MQVHRRIENCRRPAGENVAVIFSGVQRGA
jgi:hypothetical protein